MGQRRESQGGVPGGKVIRRNSHPRDLVAVERKRFLVPLNSISQTAGLKVLGGFPCPSFVRLSAVVTI